MYSDRKSRATPWSSVVPTSDELRYERAGFGGHGGVGASPAVLVIDVQYRTVGHHRVPIDEAMAEYPTACGLNGWNAVDNIERLLAVARSERVPILHPYVSQKEAYDAGPLRHKSPSLAAADSEGYRFVAEVAPLPGEILLPKKHPSAFFGTPLISYLVDRRIDTLVLCGCTTSGCVRATATDAFAYNFRVVVPADCVYDRSSISHAVNLFDIDSKYGDVMETELVLDYLAGEHGSQDGGAGA